MIRRRRQRPVDAYPWPCADGAPCPECGSDNTVEVGPRGADGLHPVMCASCGWGFSVRFVEQP